MSQQDLERRVAALEEQVRRLTLQNGSVKEHFRGWLSRIRAESDPRRQVVWYEYLRGLLDFYAEWQVEPFDVGAADQFMRLRAMRLRIGSQDLKIAAIALTRDATLVT